MTRHQKNDSHQRTNRTMPATRNELARVLADIDQLLAELEDIAEDPPDDDGDRALELLIEFDGWRKGAEAKLTGE
jgi:hypothetical protein